MSILVRNELVSQVIRLNSAKLKSARSETDRKAAQKLDALLSERPLTDDELLNAVRTLVGGLK